MYLRLAWSLAEVPLTDLVKTRGFILKNVSAVNEDGQPRVALDFEYSLPAGSPAPSAAPQDRSSHMVIRGGRIYCDPNRLFGWPKRSYGRCFRPLHHGHDPVVAVRSADRRAGGCLAKPRGMVEQCSPSGSLASP
jgi:hypothetical protein